MHIARLRTLQIGRVPRCEMDKNLPRRSRSAKSFEKFYYRNQDRPVSVNCGTRNSDKKGEAQSDWRNYANMCRDNSNVRFPISKRTDLVPRNNGANCPINVSRPRVERRSICEGEKAKPDISRRFHCQRFRNAGCTRLPRQISIG